MQLEVTLNQILLKALYQSPATVPYVGSERRAFENGKHRTINFVSVRIINTKEHYWY
jgi:hypothetical protein